MSPSVVFVIEDLVVDSLLLTFESVTVEVWGDICVECAVDLLNLVVDAAIVVKLVESILLVVDESCVVNMVGVVAVNVLVVVGLVIVDGTVVGVVVVGVIVVGMSLWSVW